MQKKTSIRPQRTFSESIRRQVVKDIEDGKVSVLGVARELGVSFQSVYYWLNKYSRHLQSSQRIVIEMESEAYKSQQLAKRVQELEAALGRKQMEIDFLNKLIEMGKEELGIDLKKKSFTPPFNGLEQTKGNITTP